MGRAIHRQYPVRRYLHQVRPARGRVYQEVLYEPGEAMQVDWGDCGRLMIGQTSRRVSVFVAVLCYSRLCYIEFSLSQCKAEFYRALVHARVHYDGNRYSVPPALVRKPVMLRASAGTVRILDQGREVARHERCYEKGQLLVHPDHRLAALKMRRRRQADSREEEFDALGPEAREFHRKLLSLPVKATVHLRRLLGLVRLYGRKEVLAAIGKALQYQTCDAAYVETHNPGKYGFLFSDSGGSLSVLPFRRRITA
jgi:hypothetical protein